MESGEGAMREFLCVGVLVVFVLLGFVLQILCSAPMAPRSRRARGLGEICTYGSGLLLEPDNEITFTPCLPQLVPLYGDPI